MTNTVYLNGNYLPLKQATVSVTDRGFLFADGIYEVIPVYNGHIFRCEAHLQRLDQSLAAVQITSPLTHQQWQTIFQELITRNKHLNCTIYLQVTRGEQAIRHHGFIHEQLTPTVYVRTTPFQADSIEQLAKGYVAITLDDKRHEDCYIKSTSLLSNVLLFQQAQLAGADEAILINNGHAIEGTSSNLFIVNHSMLITSPEHPHMLGGITRQVILELAKQHGIAYQERFIKADELAQADEIWLTSSSREIRPIIRLNDAPVGNGQAGPLWRRMIELYKDFIAHWPQNKA